MSYASEVLADSPLGYWDLQETSGTNLNDQGSGNKDGTAGAGVTVNQSGPVVGANKAVLVAAAGAAIDFIGAASGAYMLNANFSIEFWAKNVTLPGAGSFDGIWEKYHGNTGAGWGIYYDSTGRVSLKRNNVDFQVANVAGDKLSSTWKHFVVTYDDTAHVAKWYVNGVLSATTSITYPDTTDTTHDMGLGWEYDSGNGNNYLAHAALYTTVLSPEAVARHYAIGAGVSAPLDVLHSDASPLVGKVLLPAGEILLKAVAATPLVGKLLFPEVTLDLKAVSSAARVGWANVFEFTLRIRSRLTVRMPRR